MPVCVVELDEPDVVVQVGMKYEDDYLAELQMDDVGARRKCLLEDRDEVWMLLQTLQVGNRN